MRLNVVGWVCVCVFMCMTREIGMELVQALHIILLDSQYRKIESDKLGMRKKKKMGFRYVLFELKTQ